MNKRNKRKKLKREKISLEIQRNFSSFLQWPETQNGLTFKQVKAMNLSPFIPPKLTIAESLIVMNLLESTLLQQSKEAFLKDPINNSKPPLKVATSFKNENAKLALPYLYIEVPWAKILLAYGTKKQRSLLESPDSTIESYLQTHPLPFLTCTLSRSQTIKLYIKTPKTLLRIYPELKKTTTPINFFLTLETLKPFAPEEISSFLGNFTIPPQLNPLTSPNILCKSIPLYITLGNFCSSTERATLEPFIPHPSLPSIDSIHKPLLSFEARQEYLSSRKI